MRFAEPVCQRNEDQNDNKFKHLVVDVFFLSICRVALSGGHSLFFARGEQV